MLGKVIATILQPIPRITLSQPGTSVIAAPTVTSRWGLIFARTKMRYHFPHPNERKRVKKFGWFARMATLSGRKIIMRRILKGKHVLTH
ncbi:hypothetical protein KM043_001331 [Ampulex compressa]|nr:hypothetical protein KM043_001331 [Ampulex compressa]